MTVLRIEQILHNFEDQIVANILTGQFSHDTRQVVCNSWWRYLHNLNMNFNINATFCAELTNYLGHVSV